MNINSLFGAAVTMTVAGLSPTGAQEMTVTETIDFEQSDQSATAIAREMYGADNPYLRAVAFWLIPPSESEPQQIAVKMGSENCEDRCEVGVLYYVGDQWAEIWRRPVDILRVGVENEITGLKNLIDAEREWTWTGEFYAPFPQGPYPASRQPRPEELAAVQEYLLNVGFAGMSGSTTVDGSLGATVLDLKEGDEVAIPVADPTLAVAQSVPVVFLDGEGRAIGHAVSLGPDVRVGEGVDGNGFRLVEVAVPDGVVIQSVSEMEDDVAGDSTPGPMRGEVLPEPVTRAGSPRTLQ